MSKRTQMWVMGLLCGGSMALTVAGAITYRAWFNSRRPLVEQYNVARKARPTTAPAPSPARRAEP